jgi:hypothetical protein
MKLCTHAGQQAIQVLLLVGSSGGTVLVLLLLHIDVC